MSAWNFIKTVFLGRRVPSAEEQAYRSTMAAARQLLLEMQHA